MKWFLVANKKENTIWKCGGDDRKSVEKTLRAGCKIVEEIK